VVEIILIKIVGLVRRWHLATVEMGLTMHGCGGSKTTPIFHRAALAHKIAWIRVHIRTIVLNSQYKKLK